MRHAYVGDVGDFGKYGLLRAIAKGKNNPRLGIVWYLSDAEEANNDGRHDGYLKPQTQIAKDIFRSCDIELFDFLKSCREKKHLHLSLIEQSSVLPENTLFFTEPLPHALRGISLTNSWQIRKYWAEKAVLAVADADCVFVDPDNGLLFADDQDIAAPTRQLGRPSWKHAYWHEIRDYLQRGIDVIAYHHLNRRGSHLSQIETLLSQIANRGYKAIAIRFRRGSGRTFLLIPSRKSRYSRFNAVAKEYTKIWKLHSELVTVAS